MRKKILYTQFESSEKIIDSLLSSPEMKKALMRNNLYKFWEKIVGEKFAKKSKPYSMMGNQTMVVACANAAVAQELMLNKFKILKEFEPYLKSLKLKIKDIKFDCKKWEKENS